MKKLDNKVNIIPVIAKADTISKPELSRFKVYKFFFKFYITVILIKHIFHLSKD